MKIWIRVRPMSQHVHMHHTLGGCMDMPVLKTSHINNFEHGLGGGGWKVQVNPWECMLTSRLVCERCPHAHLYAL